MIKSLLVSVAIVALSSSAFARGVNLDPNIEVARMIRVLSAEFGRSGITANMTFMQASGGGYWGDATEIVRLGLKQQGYDTPRVPSTISEGFRVSRACRIRPFSERADATLRCWAEAFVYAKRVGGAL